MSSNDSYDARFPVLKVPMTESVSSGHNLDETFFLCPNCRRRSRPPVGKGKKHSLVHDSMCFLHKSGRLDASQPITHLTQKPY